MRFKIQGEQEQLKNEFSTTVEILGKKSIERLIDNKISQIIKDLTKENEELRQRVLNLEEDMAIKRKELLKFKDE